MTEAHPREHILRLTVSETEAGLQARTLLNRRLGTSRQLLVRLRRSGELLINGQAALLKQIVQAGDQVTVTLREEKSQDITPWDLPLDIVFEDEHLLIVNKPPGIVVHPTKGYMSHTLANAVVHHWQQTGDSAVFRPVHRLDRDTSGLVIIAKNPLAQESLSLQHQQDSWHKEYFALVTGSMEGNEGRIDAPIHRVGGGTRRRIISPLGQRAVTLWQVLQRLEGATAISARLVTGRTHQIRAHLAHIGYPLYGDDVYGTTSPLITRQALHAVRVSFRHPIDRREMSFLAPLPQDIESLLLALGSKDVKV